jgi:sarcosine oxidase subunit beta
MPEGVFGRSDAEIDLLVRGMRSGIAVVGFGYIGTVIGAVLADRGWPVTGIDVRSGKVVGINTTRGYIHTDRVLSAVAGSTPAILDMVGLDSPIFVHPLQAMVSEPTKPWLDPIVVSGSLHVYVSQSARGELVMGASLDPYELHSTRSTLDFVEGLAAHMLDLFPFLSPLKVVRQWAGMADMTPNFSPLLGHTPIDVFYLYAGWGPWLFKAPPIAATTMATDLAETQTPP